MTDEQKAKNFYISLSLLEMTYCAKKNVCLDGIELHFYVFLTIAIHYWQTRPDFVIIEDNSYLDILLYKSSVKIYLPVTKSVFQAK